MVDNVKDFVLLNYERNTLHLLERSCSGLTLKPELRSLLIS